MAKSLVVLVALLCFVCVRSQSNWVLPTPGSDADKFMQKKSQIELNLESYIQSMGPNIDFDKFKDMVNDIIDSGYYDKMSGDSYYTGDIKSRLQVIQQQKKQNQPIDPSQIAAIIQDLYAIGNLVLTPGGGTTPKYHG